MNTHPVTEESLMAYLDGELDPGAATGVAAHLELCRDCQAVAADLQSVERFVSSWTAGLPNPDLPRNLTKELDSRPLHAAPQRKFYLFGRLAAHRGWAISSALAAAIALGLLVNVHRAPGDVPAQS